MSSSSLVQSAMGDVRDALGSSLCLAEVMQAAQPALLRLLGGDHAALGCAGSAAAGSAAAGAATAGDAAGARPALEWITSDGLPAAFFADHTAWAAQDFVLQAVTRRPLQVLRDTEMVSRAALVANPFHRRARELGVPLEHVMAVMLHAGGLSSGLAIYRERPRPFSEREQARLRALVPAMAHAVRNCQVFAVSERRARVFEQIVTSHDRALIVLDASCAELFRTEPATRLLSRWFARATRPALPEPLATVVERWLARADETTPITFWRAGSPSVLLVAPAWVADARSLLLSLVLEERPRPPWSPAAWARLTRRQRAVVAGVVRGWDNQLIASELGCRVATIKRHLTQIFDALGVGSRSQLMAGALTTARDSVYSSVELKGKVAPI